MVAAREVRELARLCLSSERLIGEMVGVALLGIERRAREEAVRRNQDVAGWTCISEEDEQALKRVLWVAPARFGLWAGPLAGGPPPLGQCTGLMEGLGLAYHLRGYLHDELPHRYAALTTALAVSPCRLRRARLAWAGDPTAGGLPVEGSALCLTDLHQVASCAVPQAVVRLPFVRAFIGVKLAGLGRPDSFKQYRDRGDTRP